MGVLQDSGEVAFAETLAVAAEKLAHAIANHRCANRIIVMYQRRHRATEEIECLVTRETLASASRASVVAILLRRHGDRCRDRLRRFRRTLAIASPASASTSAPAAPASLVGDFERPLCFRRFIRRTLGGHGAGDVDF